MLKNKHLVALGSLLLAGFLGFSYLIHVNRFKFVDFDTTVRIQNHVSNVVALPFSTLSLIGSAEVSSLILLLLLFLVMKVNKINALLLYGLMGFVELFGKLFVDHPGPPFLFFKYNLGFFFPSSHVQPGSSYPSGHAARTAFISFAFIAFLLNSNRFTKKIKVTVILLILVFDAFMFVSRVYLGEHWTTDVIGGVLLGASFGIFSQIPLGFKKKQAVT